MDSQKYCYHVAFPHQDNHHELHRRRQQEEVEQEAECSRSYFQSLPLAFHFRPTDVELVVYYLQMKIQGKPLPPNRIHEVNLYTAGPQCITEKYEKGNEYEWFFFTPRARKHRNGFKPDRSTGDGYWKASVADKAIPFNGRKLGTKKALVFYDGKSGVRTDWIMHEFVLEGPPRERKHENDMRLDDCVLCRIYNKKEKFQTCQSISSSSKDQESYP